MRTAKIRQALHNYIDSADTKKLKAIHTLLENELSGSSRLTASQKEELDKRYNDNQKGISMTLSWDETVTLAENALRQITQNSAGL